MGFTVEEAFELLFALSRAESPDQSVPRQSYNARKWFRRPLPGPSFGQSNAVESSDVRSAEGLLVEKIKSSIPAWQEQLQTVAQTSAGAEGVVPDLTKTNPGSETVSGSEPPHSAPPTAFDPVRHIPPRMPYDVFAIAAYLIETAGIYHHIQSSKVAPGDPPNPLIRHMAITREDRDAVASAARAWVSLEPTAASGKMVKLAAQLTEPVFWQDIQPLFESWWVVFGASAGADVFDRLVEYTCEVPVWWKHAWRLLAIADEAAARTGFQFDISEMHRVISGKKTQVRWFEFEVMVEHVLRALPSVSVDSGPGKPAEFDDITSLSVARQSIVTVLPKVRTSAVGCTLRSLSHHLALLPGAGVARGRWTPNYVKPQPALGSMPEGIMNLLLVPLPYSLHATSFSPGPFEKVSGGEEGTVPHFGYFDVNQHWITDNPGRGAEIITFLQALIDAAKRQSHLIQGIVFPELALDYDTFKLVRDHVRKTVPEAAILISGLASDGAGRRGNFVAAVTIEQPSGSQDERSYRETVREKHHRWKLEAAQLHDYGLLGVLSPELAWWENISLQNRRVDFTVLRRDSVFAAMICEDLARVDPCQQVIRAVGPNLVVALLMDAPQLAARWLARYATVLAEDPGCAVLTLTSRGLMTRQHQLGIFRSNGDDRIVGLWRDDRNVAPTELKCPYDAQAVLLTIVEESSKDISLDGRVDLGAKAWRYVGNVPIRVPTAKTQFAHILGEDDLACW